MNRIKVYIIIFQFLLFLTGCTGPDHKINQVEGMVHIPAGIFEMGGNSNQAQKDEFPVRKIKMKAFLMDESEVTNQQFAEFVEKTGYITVAERAVDWQELKKQLPEGTPKPPDSLLAPGSLVFKPTDGPVKMNDVSQWWIWVTGASWKNPEGPGSTIDNRMNHPVVHIALEDAIAYADWADKRLPSEAEWEYSAAGGNENIYPWGNESPEQAYNKANFWQGFFPFKNDVKDGFFGTAPVKSFPPNEFGLYDMAGNVWEWCEEEYKSYSNSSVTGSGQYVIRGGSFLCNDSYCSGYRVSRRMATTKDTGYNHTGFRCVRDID